MAEFCWKMERKAASLKEESIILLQDLSVISTISQLLIHFYSVGIREGKRQQLSGDEADNEACWPIGGAADRLT